MERIASWQMKIDKLNDDFQVQRMNGGKRHIKWGFTINERINNCCATGPGATRARRGLPDGRICWPDRAASPSGHFSTCRAGSAATIECLHGHRVDSQNSHARSAAGRRPRDHIGPRGGLVDAHSRPPTLRSRLSATHTTIGCIRKRI